MLLNSKHLKIKNNIAQKYIYSSLKFEKGRGKGVGLRSKGKISLAITFRIAEYLCVI